MKMPEKPDKKLIAPCGMNCLVCYKFTDRRKPCKGCQERGAEKPPHCAKCGIKDCVSAKKMSYCYECADFPCSRLKRLEKSYNQRYNASLLGNGKFVREHGLDEFLDVQRQRYTCPKCGGIISVHDLSCGDCREKFERL